jgi:hypothetical protein
MHMILAVTDQGTPRLTRYRRVVTVSTGNPRGPRWRAADQSSGFTVTMTRL